MSSDIDDSMGYLLTYQYSQSVLFETFSNIEEICNREGIRYTQCSIPRQEELGEFNQICKNLWCSAFYDSPYSSLALLTHDLSVAIKLQ